MHVFSFVCFLVRVSACDSAAPRQIGSGVPCAVRIFVAGVLEAESTAIATDVPLAVEGDRNGAIYVLPNGYGRAAELRLWAAARSDSDIAMLKDTNLNLAVKRKALKAKIHEASCDCATCKAAKVRVRAAVKPSVCVCVCVFARCAV